MGILRGLVYLMAAMVEGPGTGAPALPSSPSLINNGAGGNNKSDKQLLHLPYSGVTTALLVEELQKPLNGLDVKDIDTARLEVIKLRTVLHEVADESYPDAIKALSRLRPGELKRAASVQDPGEDDVCEEEDDDWTNLRSDPEVALRRLKVGNARFLSGTCRHPHTARQWRHATVADGQHPFCTVLACSDSRAPVPLLFDAGIGDIFCVNVAGNVLSHTGLASIEYGVGHLGTPILLVLGHSGCGAVTAVVKHQKVEGSIPHLLSLIEPARAQAVQAHPECGLESDEMVAHVIEANIWLAVEHILEYSHAVRALVMQGKLIVEGAVYNVEEGHVRFLGTHAKQAEILAS